ncbi:hypothetical protein [Catenulispora pinisilvae]|uniref:hypothetical protein n=1 Tax=Catenulispora pinisilvae TaxID=2705253 RepID=UPI001890D392|nr:hypothetical protein [Catenulispora pinisilvae]
MRVNENPIQTQMKPLIVTCPACAGTGRVLGDDSQVRVACRLCWEHGVVARIAAEQYLRAKEEAPQTS